MKIQVLVTTTLALWIAIPIASGRPVKGSVESAAAGERGSDILV
jgi:hypothetical protein